MSGNAESCAASVKPAGPQPTISTSTNAGAGPAIPDGRTRSAGSAMSGSPGSKPFRWNCMGCWPGRSEKQGGLRYPEPPTGPRLFPLVQNACTVSNNFILLRSMMTLRVPSASAT